jgi:hypothetical protein
VGVDGSSRARLAHATRDLVVAWESAKPKWRDARAAEFEKRFLEGLPEAAGAAIGAMEELAALLGRVRQDCE